MGAEVATRGSRGGRELATRVVVGAGLIIIALFALVSSLWAFGALVLIAVGLGLFEWHRMFGGSLSSLGAGFIYLGVPAFALIWLRQRPMGAETIGGMMLAIWACDIGAFAIGRLVGGPKLWPVVSPGKTWAGFVGGCFAPMALVGLSMTASAEYRLGAECIVVFLVIALLAQGGDLFESWLKRRAGVKDSGTLLPGHGGVLDRIDSLIPVAPAVAGAVALGWL